MIKLDQNRFYTIGHRGMEKGEVENSLKAFSKAIELGLDFVEMDLQITKDDKIIVFHDRNLKKKTSLRGKPKDFTLEKIKDTHIETEAGKDKIPTLEQVFKLVKNQSDNLKMILELKSDFKLNILNNLIQKYKFQNSILI